MVDMLTPLTPALNLFLFFCFQLNAPAHDTLHLCRTTLHQALVHEQTAGCRGSQPPSFQRLPVPLLPNTCYAAVLRYNQPKWLQGVSYLSMCYSVQ